MLTYLKILYYNFNNDDKNNIIQNKQVHIQRLLWATN